MPDIERESWCIPGGLSPGRIDLVSEDSHLVRTRLACSDRYVLCVQNETPSIRLCMLFILISCSMSCTVRKTRLSDWCQDSMIDCDILNVKVSRYDVDTLGGTRIEVSIVFHDRDGFDPS